MDLGSSNPTPTPTPSPSSGEKGLMEMELDAARALADFKQMAKIERRERDLDESRSEHADLVDDDPQDNKATEAVVEERIKIEQDPELSISSISCISSHVSCFGRRMKQNMTEAEREAKRIRRVLANRESARQTIQRRQALREELIKRVADLSRENKDMKMEKELVMKEYLSLKDRNKELKEQVVKTMESEAKVGAEITMRHVPPSTSPSTELSLVAPWPSISSASVAYYEEGGSSKACTSRNQFFVPTCAWFYPLFPQTSGFFPSSSHASGDKGVDFTVNPHESGHCTEVGDNVDRVSLHVGSKTNVLSAETGTSEEETNTGINLEEMPIAFDRHNKVSEHDPGGEEGMSPCPSVKHEQEIGIGLDMKIDQVGSVVAEKSQVVSNLPVMKLVDPAAAAAARKRRKELTKLKYLHGKQIRLHG